MNGISTYHIRRQDRHSTYLAAQSSEPLSRPIVSSAHLICNHSAIESYVEEGLNARGVLGRLMIPKVSS